MNQAKYLPVYLLIKTIIFVYATICVVSSSLSILYIIYFACKYFTKLRYKCMLPFKCRYIKVQ